MRSGVEVRLDPGDRERLEPVVADRNSLQKHVWRAEIVLLTADGLGTNEIMRRTGKSKPCVWRWQERFMTDGVDGLLRDKTRPPGKAPLSDAVVAEMIEREAPNLPWGRLGTPADIGQAAAFLCSDEADYITGTVVRVDGAFVLKDCITEF